LAEGQVLGWVIIPANLSTGDAFFDAAKSLNITIEGEEQKTVLGANRTVTHASDPGRAYLEWDKATGVYVHYVAHTSNYTVTMNVFATNMWVPQTQGQSQTKSNLLFAATLVLALLILALVIFIAQRKNA
jgi:hypothetical protein